MEFPGMRWQGFITILARSRYFFADSKPFCQCDDVRTGACVDSNNENVFCAVSGEVCDTSSGFKFLEVLELEAKLSTTCNLCDMLSDFDLNNPVGGQNKSGLNAGEIAGITVGSVLGLLLIVGMSIVIFRKEKKPVTSPKSKKNNVALDEQSLNSVL